MRKQDKQLPARPNNSISSGILNAFTFLKPRRDGLGFLTVDRCFLIRGLTPSCLDERFLALPRFSVIAILFCSARLTSDEGAKGEGRVWAVGVEGGVGVWVGWGNKVSVTRVTH